MGVAVVVVVVVVVLAGVVLVVVVVVVVVLWLLLLLWLLLWLLLLLLLLLLLFGLFVAELTWYCCKIRRGRLDADVRLVWRVGRCRARVLDEVPLHGHTVRRDTVIENVPLRPFHFLEADVIPHLSDSVRFDMKKSSERSIIQSVVLRRRSGDER